MYIVVCKQLLWTLLSETVILMVLVGAIAAYWNSDSYDLIVICGLFGKACVLRFYGTQYHVLGFWQ